MGRKIFASLVAVLFFYIASPLFFPIAMGGVLAVLFSPSLDQLERKNLSTGFSSVLVTTAITGLFLLPISLLIFLTANTGLNQLQVWKRSQSVGSGILDTFLATPKIHGLITWVTGVIPIDQIELTDTLQGLTGSVWAKVAELLGEVLTHLPGMVVSLAIVVVSVYFFLMDGKKLVQFLRKNSVFSPRQTDHLIHTVAEMCRSVILASVVSGVIQAVLEVVICFLTGTPRIALLGFLVFVGSFIPLVGSLPITIAVALQQLAEGRQTAGIALLVAAVVMVALDNTVRPLFLRGSVNLHPLLGFVAAFGGLQTLGFLGVFLGPIVAALFVAILQVLAQVDGKGPVKSA